MQNLVIKIGGSLAGEHVDILAAMINKLLQRDTGVVLVHGGGPRISKVLAKQELEMPWLEGQRVTSAAAVHVVHDVLCREVNQELVQTLVNAGIQAQGMCGADEIIVGSLLPKLQRTADVGNVITRKLTAAQGTGNIPVIAPVGRAADGQFCNINADLAAASIADKLEAERLIFLTDVDGVYYDWENKRKLVDTRASALLDWLEHGAFTSGMIPKARAVLRGLGGSVASAYIVDGSDEEAVLAAAVRPEGDPWNIPGGTRIISDIKEEVK